MSGGWTAERKAAYDKERRAALRRAALCVRCKNPSPRYHLCDTCRAIKAVWWQRNKHRYRVRGGKS